jgi:hypothetical protein
MFLGGSWQTRGSLVLQSDYLAMRRAAVQWCGQRRTCHSMFVCDAADCMRCSGMQPAAHFMFAQPDFVNRCW